MKRILSGKPSVDKPYTKYYTEEQKNFKIPEGISPFTMFCDLCERQGDEEALTFVLDKERDFTLTGNDLKQLAIRVAKTMSVLGVVKGDTVAVCCEPTPEAVSLFLACDIIEAQLTYLNLGSSEDMLLDCLTGEGSDDPKNKAKLLIMTDKSDTNNVPERFLKIADKTVLENVVVVKFDESVNSNQTSAMLSKEKEKEKESEYEREKKTEGCKFWQWQDFVGQSDRFVGELIPSINQSAKLLIARTSGTTGRQKSVQLSKRNVLGNICGYLAKAKFDRGKVWLDVVQIDPVYGLLNCLFMPLLSGARGVVVVRNSLQEFGYAIQKYKINYLNAPPIFYKKLFFSDPYLNDINWRNVEYLSYGGDYLSPGVEQYMNEIIRGKGCKIKMQCGIGNTETSSIGGFSFHDCNEPASFGIVPPGLEIKVVDPKTGEELGYHQTGEFCYGGYAVSDFGYLGNPELSKAKFRDGWFRTGDYGYLDENGLGYFRSREDDIIIVPAETGVEKVYPSALENVIRYHPAVLDCTVIGIGKETDAYPDVAAKIVLRPEVTETQSSALKEDIRKLCIKHLSDNPNVAPKVILYTKSPLAINPNGKVDKRIVAKECEEFLSSQ